MVNPNSVKFVKFIRSVLWYYIGLDIQYTIQSQAAKIKTYGIGSRISERIKNRYQPLQYFMRIDQEL